LQDPEDPKVLAALLRYEPETGLLFWKPRPESMFPTVRSAAIWNARFAGKEAFTAKVAGYKHGCILYKKVRAHRVIWAMTHGEWPQDDIDHINGDPSDNRLANLREVSTQENAKNSARPRDNTSGHMGVSWHAQNRRWRARIKHDGRSVSLGLFREKEDAVAAWRAAADRFGYHPNHGRSQ
jgi:hypothetical protein